jgi:hypothetical protein
MNADATFRIPRHDVGPLEPWRGSLASNAQLANVIETRTPTPDDGADLLACYRDRAALASLFDDASGERDDAVARAAAAAHAAALAQTHDSGWIEVARDGAAVQRSPAGSSALTPGLWLAGWSLALVARDADAVAALCDQRTQDACIPPPGRADTFWPLVFSALASLAVAPRDVPRAVVEARWALAQPASVVEPGYVDHLLLPLLELGEHLVEGNQTGWDATVAVALSRHAAWYGTEERRFDRAGFLAFGVLGITALAHDRSLTTHVESSYVPPDLVTGRFTRSNVGITYVYPTQRLSRSDAAHWFLDLEGFPNAGRSHHLVELGDDLVARYQASGAPGVSQATIDFVLEDDAPPLLDAGELLLVADLHAKRVDDRPDATPPALHAQRAELSEAIAALEAVIARIPEGARRVPDAEFWSERGRRVLETEPGRFEDERLRAVHATYERILADIDRALRGAASQASTTPGAPADDPEPEHEARATALLAIEVLRAQVTPLLELIAHDRTGEVVRALRPRDDDYERVFLGAAAAVARRGYEVLWNEQLKIAYPRAHQTLLLCYLAPAGMLADENELSRQFPGGYRAIADRLNPHRVWVRWKYVRPGETSGLAYDGLVWCDDHWAWFPKPYRVLGELSD